jgi:hypothetical protein
VISLVALGIVFLLRRRRSTPSPTIQPTPQMAAQPPGGAFPPPGAPVNGHQSYYGAPPPQDPSKMNLYGTQTTPPPLTNPSPAQAYGGAYFPPHQQGAMAVPPPDRGDAASPMSNYNRLSGVPPTTPGMEGGQQFQSVSPQTQSAFTHQTTPPPVEAGGTAVATPGQQGYGNAHHRGEMHELA